MVIYLFFGLPLLSCFINIAKVNLSFSNQEWSDYTSGMIENSDRKLSDVLSIIFMSIIDIIITIITFTIILNIKGFSSLTGLLDPIIHPNEFQYFLESVKIINSYNSSFFLMFFASLFIFSIVTSLLIIILSIIKNREIMASITIILLGAILYGSYFESMFFGTNVLLYINPFFGMFWLWMEMGQNKDTFIELASWTSNAYTLAYSIIIPLLAVSLPFSIKYIDLGIKKMMWRLKW